MKSYVQQRDWPRLAKWLDTLSHKDFRTTSTYFIQLTEQDLTSSDLLALFVYLVQIKPKAYLVTLLKVIVAWHKRGSLCLGAQPLLSYAQAIGAAERWIDITKFCEAIFPHLTTTEQVQHYLQAFAFADSKTYIRLLLRFRTLPCRYTLFQSLRQYEHDKDYLIETLQTLRKQGTSQDYNFSAFLTIYFGLSPNAIYSLHLDPHELGRIETSYEHFTRMMTRI